MNVSFEKAQAFYQNLPAKYRYPTLNPDYVVADAEDAGRKAFFWLEENHDFFYFVASTQGVAINGFMDLESQRGYGGPLSNCSDVESLSAFQSNYLAFLKEYNVLVEFIRFTPLLGNHKILEGIGEVYEDRETVVIDLSIDDPITGYASRNRTSIRAAHKFLSLSSVNDIDHWDIFSELYHSRMSALKADDQYLFKREYFKKLAEVDGCFLMLAYADNEPVAGCVFLVEGDYAEYHLSASTQKGFKMNATQYLIHNGVHRSKAMGAKWMNLGGGTDSDEKNSLLHFKQRFSKMHRVFRIGKLVPDQNQYDHVRSSKQMYAESTRIIFYR